jgi:hypothetical protein
VDRSALFRGIEWSIVDLMLDAFVKDWCGNLEALVEKEGINNCRND